MSEISRVLFVNGPSQDPSDRFFGWPTPLLYAIAPTVDAIRKGLLDMDIAGEIFDPWSYTDESADTINAEFRERLTGVDVICASTTYDSLYPTMELLRIAKEYNREIITILGGPHVDEIHTFPGQRDIALRPNVIDYSIAGDGEFVLLELLKDLSRSRVANVHEVMEKSSGKAWLYDRNGQCASIQRPFSLESLPFIPIDLAASQHRQDFDIFSDGHERVLPTVQMLASRGCPYSCTFCSQRVELAGSTIRSVEHILTELELRKSQGFEAIFFDDNTFGAHPHLSELLGELGRSGMKFGCLNRFNHLMIPRVVEKYRDAGFSYMACSIEQFDDAALRDLQKGQKMHHIERGLESLANSDIGIGVFQLYGLPSETEGSIRATMDFTRRWVECGVVKMVSEAVLSYHPGTPDGLNRQCEFNRKPPHIGYPWNRFEEGQWYHPPHVTEDYLENIIGISNAAFAGSMHRNGHSWIRT